MTHLGSAAPARLPGFHVCVGSGGERLLPEWYTEKGDAGLDDLFNQYASHLVKWKLFKIEKWD